MQKFQILLLLLIATISISNAATPWLHVEGNHIKDPLGNTVVLRGVALQDITGQMNTAGIGMNGLLDTLTNVLDTSAAVNGWYTRVVRFTINPGITDFQAYYNNILKPSVDSAKSKGLYVIIDNHFIADVQPNVDYTTKFWTFFAPLFRNYSNVLYEIYNEPINNSTGSWTTVKPIMQKWVDLIRSYAPHNLILAGNPLWDQRSGDAAINPLAGANIVYVVHLYPGHWTNVANRTQVENAVKLVPVFLSEWGFYNATPTTTDILKGTITSFGKPIITWADSLGLSWTAWCADNDWLPSMFTTNWVLRRGEGEMGGFAKQKLYDDKDKNQPVDIACVAPYLGFNKTICSNIPVTITTGLDTSGKVFRWYKDGILIPSEAGPSLSAILGKGLYGVEVDTNGCTMKHEISVLDTLFNVEMTPNAVLTDSIVLVAGDPTAGYTYQWYKNSLIIPNATSNTLKVMDTCKTIFSVNVSYPSIAGCGTKTGTFEALCLRGPFLGSPVPVPGIIQAENYDFQNLPNTSYHDFDAGNTGNVYRNDDVDIQATTDAGGGYNVYRTSAGDWLKYSIKVTDPGICAISFRVASRTATGALHADLNQVANVTGTVTILPTGASQTWTTVVMNGINFAATDTLLGLYIETGGFNINYMQITKGSVGINEIGKIPSIVIYPNPGVNEINISGTNTSTSFDWKISNILGSEVLQGSGAKADISSLQRGQYFLIIEGKAFKILKW